MFATGLKEPSESKFKFFGLTVGSRPAVAMGVLKSNVGLWSVAECHERLLPGFSLESPKAAGGEHPLRVCCSQSAVRRARL